MKDTQPIELKKNFSGRMLQDLLIVAHQKDSTDESFREKSRFDRTLRVGHHIFADLGCRPNTASYL